MRKGREKRDSKNYHNTRKRKTQRYQSISDFLHQTTKRAAEAERLPADMITRTII
jgi:hypothetical protein